MTQSDPIYDLTGKRIWVAGHRGMVGSAIVRRLEQEKPAEILTATSRELDLRRQADVEGWMDNEKPDVVFVAAAKVAGIKGNDDCPADFLYENLMIESNVIHSAHKAGVEKLIFLGSSCIYPKETQIPIKEDQLLTGKLEETNEGYAIAKIAGIRLCQAYRRQHGCDFISAMPTNLYGPGDRYDLDTSHVLPAFIRKTHEAKMKSQSTVEMWGTGKPMREFLHSDDCADAVVFLAKNYSDLEHVNVGSGYDMTIEEALRTVMDVVGFDGEIKKKLDEKDGTFRKLMSSEKLLNMGWKPQKEFKEGLREAYQWFLENEASGS